ncbi:TetR/AcrR family transcriptional regulator [Allokutzneria albata]|uniref:DNA-binding transcriptional regulator, AcrR family n=1 Tax=Allokutzneria albata TaxID=211114 RepID=A0A1G9VUQ2_ALLAB|nr:TetR family transcriptional regulator [Allokutzneria albata]SDM76022.1 DNA-binding transcriptional regulator, AcrR family [Allokutzneria albata]
MTTEPGLRERKKRRTRAALTDAALELFSAKGYDATRVEEISAAVEISPRTFFRYFDGKEEVALGQLSAMDEDAITALATRPAGEAPLAALRAAHTAMLDRLYAEEGGPQRFSATHRLIDSSPTLLAASLRRAAATEDRLALIIAERQDTDASTDMRCHLLVRLVFTSARLGVETACRRGANCDPDQLRATVDTAIRLATAGLPAEWSDWV